MASGKKTDYYSNIKQFLSVHAGAVEAEATMQHLRMLKDSKLRKSFLKKYQADHIQIVKEIANNLDTEDLKASILFFNQLGEKLAQKSVKDRLTLEEATDGSIFLKQALWKKVKEAGLLETLSTDQLFTLSQRVGTYIDCLSSRLSFTYHNTYLKNMEIERALLDTESKNTDAVEKRLAAIVESSDDAIISKSIDGIITSWNKGAQRLYGYEPHEIVGLPVSVLMPPGKKNDFPKIMHELQQGRKVEHYETQRQTKDGRILDVSITVSPLRDKEGKIIGASKVARDITDRKRIEKRQQFLEKVGAILGASIDYETTLKNLGKLIVPEMADYCRIVVLDEQKQIKEISINYIDKKKLPLIKNLYQSYKKDGTAGVDTMVITGKSELIPEINTDTLQGSNDQTISIVKQLNLQSYMGVPMKLGNRIIGALTFSSTNKERIYTSEDVSVAEELARRAAWAIENAHLYNEAQKAIALRDDFISVASHELRTPLTSLKMYTQVLTRQHAQKGEDTRSLERMDAQINKLTMLVQDLLNISRFQSGKFEYQDDFFDLNEVVNEVVENIQATASKHTIEIEGSISKRVWGDKDRIAQVLTNLLTNAIKYSPEADTVIVHLTAEKDSAVVTVQDFGIGIEKNHINKLFQRFYRVTDQKDKMFPGLGLGLYISNEIVKRYGGKMEVVSHWGKGSQFSFILPYKPKVIKSSHKISE